MATTATPTRRPKVATNALDLLIADHAAVKSLFTQFKKVKKAGDDHAMRATVAAICKALSIHAQIEEEIFYPALREGADADDQLDEADVEHAHLEELVAQLEDSGPGSDLFDARVKVLSEYVEHHVKEEETTLFAKARKAACDLTVLGEQLLARKEELGADDVPPPAASGNSRRHAANREVRG